MIKKNSLILFCLFILFLTGGIWLYQTRQTLQSTKYNGPIEKIVVGNTGEYSIFNLIAQENGYFKENGLDASIIEYPSGPPALNDLLAGKINFAIASEFAGVKNIAINKDLRILMHASKQKVFYVVARKDKGIMTPADLRGKKVGVTKTGAGEFYLGTFLLFNNLQQKDIVIFDLPPTELVNQIKNGAIDVAVVFDPHAYNLQKQLGEAVISWSAQSEQNVFTMVYSTNSYIKDHPQIVNRYIQSLLQAEQFVKEHPVEAQNFLAKKLHYDKAYIEYMWPHFVFENRLEQELLLTMEDETRWAITNNLIKQKVVPNYLDFIYFPALEQVKPDAVTISY